jgi:murein DD-endopeptidase MepM/ murein hydrolase activator NlpD
MRQLRALVVIGALVLAGQGAARLTSTPTTYKVKRGDTLSTIARRHHVAIADLVAANKLADPNRIREGQLLSLVPPPPPPPPAPAPAPLSTEVVVLGGAGTATYIVVKGDNLSDLAKRFSTTVAELRKLNNLKPFRVLRIGVTLNVPGTSWTCPVNGKPRNFGNDWGAPREGARFHMGNDIFAARGTPVVAPVAGRVEYRNGKVGGNAFYLHGVDGVTYYGAHLDTETAPPGNVKAGEQIGTVGNTGNAKGTTPHLHFEVHPNDHAVNPFPTLKRWC